MHFWVVYLRDIHTICVGCCVLDYLLLVTYTDCYTVRATEEIGKRKEKETISSHDSTKSRKLFRTNTLALTLSVINNCTLTVSEQKYGDHKYMSISIQPITIVLFRKFNDNGVDLCVNKLDYTTLFKNMLSCNKFFC